MTEGSRGITRRGVIAVAAGGIITGTVVVLSGWTPLQRPALSPGAASARTPLPIPPLAESTLDADGTRVFTLTAQAGTSDMVAAGPTPTWGYNGPFAGPTLRAREGEKVRVEVHNELPEATTVHWHGMKLPAQADGGPHQPIEAGGTWQAEWTVEQPAATLWYHPHHHGTTEVQVYRGLGGLFYIDDAATSEAEATVSALPHDYGVDDIPVIVTDRSFGADGHFAEVQRTAHGMLGDTLVVNGAVDAEFVAERPLTRLRLLNASAARSYSFMVEDAPMWLVGTDNGLLPEPVEATTVTLTPGERAEVLVRLDASQETVLQSVPHSLGLMKSTARSSGCDDRFNVLALRAGSGMTEAEATGGPDPELLAGLAAAIPSPLETPDATREFALSHDQINGKSMNMARVDETVTVGARERWIITNEHHLPHNFHVHNARFTVVSVGGEEPRETERGWKDTVYAPPRLPVVIDVEFGSSSDPAWPYMYHCHLLQHEDAGMMGQFVVVSPGSTVPPEIDTPATRALEEGGQHVGH